MKHTADAKTLRNIKFSSLSFQRQQVIGVSGTLCRRLQEARSHSDSEEPGLPSPLCSKAGIEKIGIHTFASDYNV